MKSRKILAFIMVMVLTISGFTGSSSIKATQMRQAITIDGNFENPILIPGQTIHVKLPVKAVGGYKQNVIIQSIELSEDAPYSIKNISLNSDITGNKIDLITSAGGVNVEFDVVVKESASIKKYKSTIHISYDDYLSDEENAVGSLDFFMQVLEEKIPAQITVNSESSLNAVIGKDTFLSLKIKNEGEITARNLYLSLDYSDSVTNENVKRTNKEVKMGDIKAGQELSIKLPISILPTATSGIKTFKVKLDYKDIDGNSIYSLGDIYVNLQGNTKAPKIEIESITYNGLLKAGDQFILVATLKNTGDSTAQKIEVSIDEENVGIAGFIKNYFTETIEVQPIKADEKRNVKIPLIVSKEAVGGLKELKLKVKYKDGEGVEKTSTSTIYPEIIGKTEDLESDSNIYISNVKQSPSAPNAGGQVNLSFMMENKGKQNFKDIKISTMYEEGSFLPVNSEPYILVSSLSSGEKKMVTIPLLVSKDVQAGLNQITVKLDYNDDFGKTHSGEPVIIPVLNIVNDGGGLSKPKIIISKFETDLSELKAGETFKFTFELKNTNTSVTAKNITVTLSQRDNVFTVTQGSNSFFIDKISPGETIGNEVEIKIKSDSSTNTYPLDIKLDYEYDGASINPVTGEIGETKIEEINLLVIENSRPVVDYINVYSMMGMPTVNENATMSFEFYNMGKSTLSNVIATIEGDFIKADGNMAFIGNVEAGASEYVEFDVIPMTEGMVSGILKIVFEDSNGDEVVMTKDFETDVQGQMEWNPEDEFGPGMPELPEAKKPIMSTWLFVIMLISIVSIIPFVTKAIIIAIYKKRLRIEDEEF
ncbi:MAG TPA: hypothetical protein GXZ90_08925 [Clostridiales bacterium]|nr:hypothetical protein [Clostridiales bacterium]